MAAAAASAVSEPKLSPPRSPYGGTAHPAATRGYRERRFPPARIVVRDNNRTRRLLFTNTRRKCTTSIQ